MTCTYEKTCFEALVLLAAQGVMTVSVRHS